MKKRKIILAVTNDLVTDQRVHRVASTISGLGTEVLLVGRLLPNSLPVPVKQYSTKRIKMIFIKGPLFYLCFNFRLFIFIFFKKADIIISNDLDTLLACWVISNIKRIPLLYDSHELFTELPELQGRKRVQKIWRSLEKMILPKIKYAYTVCDSLADIYKKEYGTPFITIRNLPTIKKEIPFPDLYQKIKSKKIIIYQGYLNLGRGIEKIIKALPYLDDIYFLIIGKGDIESQLKKLAKQENVSDKILFTGVVPYNELHSYTQMAHLGISLEENLGKNYYYSLPNKIFDYIQAKIPVLGSSFPEIEAVVNNYQIGLTTSESDPKKLADIIKMMLSNENKRKVWLNNLEKAASELNWENEKMKLINLIKEFLR